MWFFFPPFRTYWKLRAIVSIGIHTYIFILQSFHNGYLGIESKMDAGRSPWNILWMLLNFWLDRHVYKISEAVISVDCPYSQFYAQNIWPRMMFRRVIARMCLKCHVWRKNDAGFSKTDLRIVYSSIQIWTNKIRFGQVKMCVLISCVIVRWRRRYRFTRSGTI